MYEPKGITGEGKTFSPSKKLSLTEVKVEEFQLEGQEIEDITIEPPRYREPILSIKSSGIVKFGIGLIRELQDRGDFLWISRLYVVKDKLVVLLLDEARSHQIESVRKIPLGILKFKKYEESDPEKGIIAGTFVIDDDGNKIEVLEQIRVGEVHLGKYLIRAEFSHDNKIEVGTLRPSGGTSRDFGLDGMSFDTRQVDKGTLLLVIDPTKGITYNKKRGGQIIEDDRVVKEKEMLPREYEFDEDGNKTDVTIES